MRLGVAKIRYRKESSYRRDVSALLGVGNHFLHLHFSE